MDTWAYKRNENVHICLPVNIGKKRLAACLLHNIFTAVVSECLCHLRAQYSVPVPDICIVFFYHQCVTNVRTVARKFSIGGLCISAGGLDTHKINKNLTDL